MNRFCIILLIGALALSAAAQRRITPVDNPDKKRGAPVVPEAVDTVAGGRPASVVETTDLAGHTVLVDTISGEEYRDTILTTAPKLIYPRFDAVTVGVNVWDPLMRCFGQKYGLIGFWGELSLHNWIKPAVEIGLGSANYTPDDGNYTYKSSIAPYFKIGLNYNFLYNSNPDYSVYAGLRYGVSNFSYEVTDVTMNQGYWDENVSFDIPSQRATVGYFEAMVGIRVKVLGNVSLGWVLKVHRIAHGGKGEYGEPWYVPGYGAKSSLFNASFSVSYTLPLGRRQTMVPPGADAEEE